jgi:ABC-type uncharacterized transport system ATPase subunit
VRAATRIVAHPEDRHDRALVLDYSVAENLILGQQHRLRVARRSTVAACTNMHLIS